MGKKDRKPKAKDNKAVDVEKKTSKELTSEQLALMLNQNYQQMMAIQNNIREINAELEKRTKIKE